MATQDNEWISEEDAARQLGVNRADLRAQRPHLGAGEIRKQGNVVQWLTSAAQRVAGKLGIVQKNAAPEKTAPGLAAPPQDAGEELTVYSQPMGPNLPHFAQEWLFRAQRANGEIVVVRVLDSRKFMPKLRTGEPMRFRSRKAPQGNWWLLTGREPRFPGKF